jgi:hypothetical protein
LGGKGGIGVVREGVGEGRRNDPSLYAHMNKIKVKKIVVFKDFVMIICILKSPLLETILQYTFSFINST